MATIDYKCDTCNRQISLLENPNGLTTLSRCTITSGCRGRMFKTKRNPNGLRESIPSPVENLQNKQSRKVFNTHTQADLSDIWFIKHNLATHPLIILYKNIDGVLVKQDDDTYSVDYLSPTDIEISLPTASTGVVHLLSRFSEAPVIETTQVSMNMRSISERGVFTFGVPKLLTVGSSPDYPLGLPIPYDTMLPYKKQQEFRLPYSQASALETVAGIYDNVEIYYIKSGTNIEQRTSNLNLGVYSLSQFLDPNFLGPERDNYPISWSPDDIIIIKTIDYFGNIEGGVFLDVVLERVNREPVSCTEKLIPMSPSVWRGVKEVIVRRRKNYYVFNKSINDFNVILDQGLSLSNIENGTILRIIGIRYGARTNPPVPIKSKGLLGLISNSGNNGYSINVDSILDYGERNNGEEVVLLFLDGEFKVMETETEGTYPRMETIK